MPLNTYHIERWDNHISSLEIDPEITSVAAIIGMLIEEFKSDHHGVRFLRDDLPPSGITLHEKDDVALDKKKTLSELNIDSHTDLEATRADWRKTRKRYGKGFDDDRAKELELLQVKVRRREQRKREREQKKREEVENARKAARVMREIPRLEDATVDVDVGIFAEEVWEETREEVWQGDILEVASQDEGGESVELPEEDPFAGEDADKENWNPQILRDVPTTGHVGSQGNSQ